MQQGAEPDYARHLPRTTARAHTRSVSSIDDKLRILASHIDKDRNDPRVDYAVADALGGRSGGGWTVRENDANAELGAIYRWVRRKVRYTSDVEGLDTFRRPRRTLELGIGDCDDVSTVIGAMASSAGYPVGLRVVRTRGNDDWNHVYNVVGLPKADPTRWVPIDGTMAHGVGWEVSQGVEDTKTVRVERGKIETLSGLFDGGMPWLWGVAAFILWHVFGRR